MAQPRRVASIKPLRCAWTSLPILAAPGYGFDARCRWAARPRHTLINGPDYERGSKVLRVDPAAVHLAAQSHGHLDAGDRALLDVLGLDDPNLGDVFRVLID